MNSDVLRLQRYLIDGPGRGCAAFDRGAYNSFACTAQHLSYRVKTEDERTLCMWLKELALKKAKAVQKKEVSA